MSERLRDYGPSESERCVDQPDPDAPWSCARFARGETSPACWPTCQMRTQAAADPWWENPPGEVPAHLPECGGCGYLLHEPNDRCWWIDLGLCAYFRGDGRCSFGCRDEPQCHTCRPRGGWPSEKELAHG